MESSSSVHAVNGLEFSTQGSAQAAFSFTSPLLSDVVRLAEAAQI